MAEPAAAKTVDQSSSPFRPDLLHGLSALVTGGGSGICFEIARCHLPVCTHPGMLIAETNHQVSVCNNCR
jgi:hypothetical protein